MKFLNKVVIIIFWVGVMITGKKEFNQSFLLILD